MNWSLPLINPNTNHIDDDVFDAITMQQHKRFSMWSLQTGQSVIDLLRSAPVSYTHLTLPTTPYV